MPDSTSALVSGSSSSFQPTCPLESCTSVRFSDLISKYSTTRILSCVTQFLYVSPMPNCPHGIGSASGHSSSKSERVQFSDTNPHFASDPSGSWCEGSRYTENVFRTLLMTTSWLNESGASYSVPSRR